MNIINKLSLQNVKLNKKRTIGTIIGIILSVALVTAVAGMFESLQESLFRNARAETGYYHYSISGIDTETLDIIASNRQVDNIIKSYCLGYAKLDRPELKNALLTMRSIDNLEELPYRIESGRKPQNTNEIIIPASLESEGNLKVGDTLELDVGVRMTNDGYILDSSNPYHGDNEYLANTRHQTYTIVGTFTGPGSRAYYFTGETSTFYLGITTKETSDKIDAYIALKNPHEREKFVKSLYATGKFDTPTNVSADNYTLNTNYELLRWEVFAFSDETITMLYTVVGIVIAIIVISSIY